MTAHCLTIGRKERVVELLHKGLTPSQVAERLGIRRNAVYATVKAAKAREQREKTEREAGE